MLQGSYITIFNKVYISMGHSSLKKIDTDFGYYPRPTDHINQNNGLMDYQKSGNTMSPFTHHVGDNKKNQHTLYIYISYYPLFEIFLLSH